MLAGFASTILTGSALGGLIHRPPAFIFGRAADLGKAQTRGGPDSGVYRAMGSTLGGHIPVDPEIMTGYHEKILF